MNTTAPIRGMAMRASRTYSIRPRCSPHSREGGRRKREEGRRSTPPLFLVPCSLFLVPSSSSSTHRHPEERGTDDDHARSDRQRVVRQLPCLNELKLEAGEV